MLCQGCFVTDLDSVFFYYYTKQNRIQIGSATSEINSHKHEAKLTKNLKLFWALL